MTSDLEAAVREITAGLNELQAEGRQAEAEIQRWAEIARKAKAALAPHVNSIGGTAPGSQQHNTRAESPPQKAAQAVPPDVAPPIVESNIAGWATCATCGNTLKPSAKFCTKCGTTRQAAPAAAAAAPACAVCGGALRPDVRFCRACGAPAQAAQQPAPAPAPPPPPPLPLPLAAEPVWRPTHVVPPAGMAAWTTPDAAAQPIAQLGARTELELVSQRGAWAEVRASNGWLGWVDGRLLVSR